MAERRFRRRTDSRILALFSVLLGVLLVYGVHGEIQARALAQVCQRENTAHRAFDAALDQLILGSATSPVLTPAEKAQRIGKYRDLHLPIEKCPGVW